MIFSYLILAILLCLVFPMKIFFKRDQETGLVIYNNYLGKDNTLPVKGLFVVLVFLRHFKGYVQFQNGMIDSLFLRIDSKISQLIVVMFLFYSGYGIFESIKKKGNEYVKGFFKNRFMPTWINFAICITLYMIFNLIMSIEYPWWRVLLSFTGWRSIGNSNWFMFATFTLYLIFILVFSLLKNKNKLLQLITFTILSFGLMVFLYFTKRKDVWWYNTILCFPLGMWYSYYKNKIDSTIGKNNVRYFITLFVLCIAMLGAYRLTNYRYRYFFIQALVFGLLFVVMTMKLKFNSPILSFLGKHVFSIYILQRMVLIAFTKTPVVNSPYLYLVICFAIVVLLACLYDFCFKKARLYIANIKQTQKTS